MADEPKEVCKDCGESFRPVRDDGRCDRCNQYACFRKMKKADLAGEALAWWDLSNALEESGKGRATKLETLRAEFYGLVEQIDEILRFEEPYAGVAKIKGMVTAVLKARYEKRRG